jgi:hypothetical protein
VKRRSNPKKNEIATPFGLAMTCKDDKSVCIIDFHVNNGTKIAITLDPLTFILSPVLGGEGRVRGM